MISFQTFALLAPVFVSSIFALVFLPARWSVNKPRTVLKYLMLAGLAFSLAILTKQTGQFLLFPWIIPLYLALHLIFIPLFYMYIHTLTNLSFRSRTELRHLLPSFLFLVVTGILFLFLDSEARVILMKDFHDGINSFTGIEAALYFLFIANKVAFAVQAVIYYFLVRKLLIKNREIIHSLFSGSEEYQLNWLSLLNLTFLTGAANGIIINFLPPEKLNPEDVLLSVSLLLVAGFFFVMGVTGVQQLPLMQIIEAKDKNLPGPKIPSTEDPVMLSIQKFIEGQKAYLNPSLNIWDVARALNTNRSYISATINREAGMNFNTYVNKLRVEEVLRSMKEKDCPDTDALGYLCGFNSVTTFYRCFKHYTGQSPARYKNNRTRPNMRI